MAYGDVNFNFVKGGSMATSAGQIHSLFANDQSLSQLNASEVLLVRISTSSGGATLIRKLSSGDASDVFDIISLTNTSTITMYPLTVNNASQISVRRLAGTTNPAFFWSVWSRNPR